MFFQSGRLHVIAWHPAKMMYSGLLLLRSAPWLYNLQSDTLGSQDLVEEEDSTHQGSLIDRTVECTPSASGVKFCQEPALKVQFVEESKALPHTPAPLHPGL